MRHAMLRTALVVLLLAPPVASPQPPPPSAYPLGDAIDVALEGSGGRIDVYAPTPATPCLELVRSEPAPADGVLRGLPLDRAGRWRIDHVRDDATSSQTLSVVAAPLHISAMAQPAAHGPGLDYVLQIVRAQDHSVAAHAYVDLFLGESFIRHLRADADGRVTLRERDLPYTGEYRVRAYLDADAPLADYVQASDFSATDCSPNQPFDPPEYDAWGPTLGPSSSAIHRFTEPLDINATTDVFPTPFTWHALHLATRALDGHPVTPTHVRLFVDGALRATADLGLSVQLDSEGVMVSGTWRTRSQITIEVSSDANMDGRKEHEGRWLVQPAASGPLRLEPLGPTSLEFAVPPRASDGRPGVQELRFRILDETTGETGRPPEVTSDDVRLIGNVLTSSRVHYDAAQDAWVATVTPRGDDEPYTIRVQWPHHGSLEAVVDPAPGLSARSRLEHPAEGHLRVEEAGDVLVRVQRYNDHFRRYENVTNAVVQLFWADTGLPSTDAEGTPYEYDPSRPGEHALEFDGVYYFIDVRPPRAGALVAHAILGEGDHEEFTYTDIPVDPAPVYFPQVSPPRALAGERVHYEIQAGSDLTPATLARFAVQVTDEAGRDATRNGTLSGESGRVTWSASLPAGDYALTVTERESPEGKGGRFGTHTPARWSVAPAQLRFSYPDAAGSPRGIDLSKPHTDAVTLGGGLGTIDLLTVNVHDATGNPVHGTLTLDSPDHTRPVALLALSPSFAPARLAHPHLFAPGDAAGGETYYVSELDQTLAFAPTLDIPINGFPVPILVWSIDIGALRGRFQSASSTLNTFEPVAGGLRSLAPLVEVQSISTSWGQTVSPFALTAGEPNTVRLRLEDPTGLHDLSNLTVVFCGPDCGPQPRASARLVTNATRGVGVATIGLTPAATGTAHVAVARGPSRAFTQLVLPILTRDEVRTLAKPVEVYVDVPAEVASGSLFEVRVATSQDPFPSNAVVEAFGANASIVRGVRQLRAPDVNASQAYVVLVRVPGQPPVHSLLRVIPASLAGTPLAKLVVSGLPRAYEAGGRLDLTVTDGQRPVAGVQVQGPGVAASTDARGRVLVNLPDALEGKISLAFTKAGFSSAAVALDASASPLGLRRLVLTAPATFSANTTGQVRIVALVDNESVALPSRLRASVGPQWLALQVDGTAATAQYGPPRLVNDTTVLIVARAPGWETARAVVTLGREIA